MKMIEVASVLRDMATKGPLTASRLLEEAAQEAHPLHDRFTWDDTEAAHQYRLQQARHIIVTVNWKPEGARRAIPVFVHVPEKQGEGEYVLTEFAVTQPERWDRARAEALRMLKGAEDNLDGMAEAMRFHGKRPSRNLGEAQRLVKRAQTKVASA